MKHREAIAKPWIFNFEAIWGDFEPISGHSRLFREVWGPFLTILQRFWVNFGHIRVPMWAYCGRFGQIWAYLGGMGLDLGLFRGFRARFWPFLGVFGPNFGLFKAFGARFWPIEEVLSKILAYLSNVGQDFGLSRGFWVRFGSI